MTADREGPESDRRFVAPKGYWEKLKAICASNPKGRPLNAQGQLMPDPTPVAPPIGYVPEESMADRVRAMVKRELSSRAEEHGFESFEEANDFDIEDDFEPFSPYELIVEQAVPDGPKTTPDPDATPIAPSPQPNAPSPPSPEVPSKASGSPPEGGS